MSIKQVKFTIRGDHELLMHSTNGMNPYLPLSVELAQINKKRNKTEEDKLRISDIEFIHSLYWDNEKGRVYIPGWNIEKCILEGAKIHKQGTAIQRYTRVLDDKPELHYGKRLSLDELVEDKSFRDIRTVKIMRAAVLRTRPRFAPGWSVDFTVEFDDTNIDFAVVKQSVEDAGRYVGLGDFRPRYGTFVVVG